MRHNASDTTGRALDFRVADTVAMPAGDKGFSPPGLPRASWLAGSIQFKLIYTN